MTEGMLHGDGRAPSMGDSASGDGAQITALVRQVAPGGSVPQFACDAGYDPVEVAVDLGNTPVATLDRVREHRRLDTDLDVETVATVPRRVRRATRRRGAGRDRRTSSAALPPLAQPLYPSVLLAARLKASVEAKLLIGFLVGALLLLGMAGLSLLTIDQMNQRMQDVTTLQNEVTEAHKMLYDVTAQSHHRSMALLTRVPSYNALVDEDKRKFLASFKVVAQMKGPGLPALFQTMSAVNSRYYSAGVLVRRLYDAGNYSEAQYQHLNLEHKISHQLEDAINKRLLPEATRQMNAARSAFQTNRDNLRAIVIAFSVISVGLALILGFTLSWAIILPVRSMGNALERIAAGDLKQWVVVPNRDELGTLGKNLNRMSQRLASMYEELQGLNVSLRQKVGDQVKELEQAKELKRYLSPQLADSILSGTLGVSLTSKRKNLTIFYSDIRGFTQLSERMEPEELIDLLNQYLTAMTEITFKYGGTLDKYIGDAIMVFFGDPIPYEDHAERAVKMAFEMRARLAELQAHWFARGAEVLTVGMGISTGYVTVGNIGSATRMDYTVIGNHSNLASRLSTHAKAGQILVSERTFVAVQDLVDATEVDQIELKGVSRPIKIYAINEKQTPRQMRKKEKAPFAPHETGV